MDHIMLLEKQIVQVVIGQSKGNSHTAPDSV